MSIKVGEVGKLFRYATGYDMSGSNVLTLKFTSPSGAATSYTSGVTAPASIVTDPDLGSIAASTYMQYTTDGTEFTEAGLWTVCGTYQDATPKLFHGGDATFTVGEAC
tara:strand:+ start:767 stop:1090 length:324 start_codon:yes stop_codon:yes gene_type:complete